MFGKNYWEHILELNKSMKKGNEMVAASEVKTRSAFLSSSGLTVRNPGQKSFLGGTSLGKKSSFNTKQRYLLLRKWFIFARIFHKYYDLQQKIR